MDDYDAGRRKMVERQLKARGIRNERVLAAMGDVPRHAFIDTASRHEAYQDSPLPIGDGQTISQPYMVAVMTELLDLRGDERVLEIGTGSGYQTAILCELCEWVFTIERISTLADRAKRLLQEHGYHNVSFRIDDGTRGWPEDSPFDGIIVTAGAPKIPDVLVDQLADGGRLVIPVGDRFSQTLKVVMKAGETINVQSHTGCRFVDLVGEHGWSE